MKVNQLATLVLRLLGIYCFLQIVPTVATLSSLIFTMRIADHSDGLTIGAFTPVLLPLIGWLVIAILLFACSAQWGEKLTKSSNEASITTISFEQMQILAFAVVGALIFAEAISQLFGSIYSASISFKHLNKDQYPTGMQFNDWHSLLNAFGIILKTALGLWMFFGARGFANFWRSTRNFGTPKPPEN
ncbi:MAG TPA: hypothetical protein VII71_04340 [Verrucomicrobiae bacterium]